MGRGYQGAPKGGALAAAGLPLGIKAPVDGDLLVYDLASGKWVNSGNLRFGLQVQRSNVTSDGTYQTVDFPDTEDYIVNTLRGFALNDTRDAFTLPVVGTYLVLLLLDCPQHATSWLTVAVSPPCSGQLVTSIPPKSVIDYGAVGNPLLQFAGISYFGNPLAQPQFAFQIVGAVMTGITLYPQMQYLGPATSLG